LIHVRDEVAVKNPTLYVFKRDGDQCTFVLSPAFSGLMVGMFGAGSLFMLYLSSIFFLHAGEVSAKWWIGAIFILVAGLSGFFATRAWSTRRTPLSIERGGRVNYGERELCAAGSVRAVRIAASRRGEAYDCEVALEVAGGEMVFIPSQYFAVFGAREQARPFAAKLAEVLEVPVTESP
jgi:hypothetical protein